VDAKESVAGKPQPLAGLAGTIELGGEVSVNRLGFGAMRIPGARGEPNPQEANRILRRAIELGVNFLDTAHAYGRSEELIGEALHPYPADLIIATKAGYGRGRSGQWIPDGRPEALRSHVERSLQLLRLDRIDLLQLHTIDRRVPLEESIGAMVQLQSEGKVRMIGVSNFSVEELERARAVGEIVSVQNRYSLGDRRSEDVLDVCERDGIAFLPWFPLGAGRLAGESSLDAVAKAYDATPAQVALAWLLQRSPAMLPIPGTSQVAHLEEDIGAASLRLRDEDFRRLGGMSGTRSWR
jgi:aryl-alcohol dehydrogenase-like predicted oxidoreductase